MKYITSSGASELPLDVPISEAPPHTKETHEI